jgi:hypothetical protein
MLEDLLGWLRIIIGTVVGIGIGVAGGPVGMIIGGIIGFVIGGSMNDDSRPYELPKRKSCSGDYSAHGQGCPPPWWDRPGPR